MLAREHASLREDKKPGGTKAEEKYARGRADTERRKSRKERGLHGRERG